MFRRSLLAVVVMAAMVSLNVIGCDQGAVGDGWEDEELSMEARRPDISVSDQEATGATCDKIEKRYEYLTQKGSICRSDDDCQMLNGQCGMGLGGCYEFVNESVDQKQLDWLGKAYWREGCAGGVCSCLPPYFEVYCDDGRCAGEQVPPDPTCDDLGDRDFGSCTRILGWGVVDGTCRPISGCHDQLFVGFYETQKECEAECGENVDYDRCDDGSTLMCLMPIPPCGPGEIPAIKEGCYQCVNEITCQPWGKAGCRTDTDCMAGQICDYCATSSCYECDDCVPGCVDQPVAHECDMDDDCRLHSDYCGGCNCVALAPHEEPLKCGHDEMVYCIVDPCMNKEAVCARGACQVSTARPATSPARR